MPDLSNKTDIEVIQYYFKTDAETAQKLLDEGMDMDVLRGNINPYTEAVTKEIDKITSKLKKEIGDVIKDLNLEL